MVQNGRSSAQRGQGDDLQESCQELENQAQQAQEQLTQCRTQRRELSDELRRLKTKVKALTVKLPKLRIDVDGCDTTRAELTNRIPELRDQCQLSPDDQKRLEQLNIKVEECKSDMEACKRLSDRLEKEVAKLQKDILDAGGPKLKKQQMACDKTLADLNETEKKLNAARVAISSCEKAVAKAQNGKRVAEEELVQCSEQLEQKQQLSKQLENEALVVMQEYERVKEAEAEQRDAMEVVSKECESLKKSQAKLKGLEIELLGKLEACDRQAEDYRKRRKHWDNEIAKLVAAAADDDELDESDDEGDDDNNAMDEDKPSNEETMAEAAADQTVSLPVLSESSLEQYTEEELVGEIDTLDAERSTLAKNANMGAITEYKKKEADYLSR